jgi:outer membrane protein assembly factor BamD (BamD/ComL family)
MVQEKRPLKVFLCHAAGDKPPVRDLYKRLTVEGVDAWLDKEKLLPGQDWRLEIPKAVKESDVVVVCLSNNSVTKEGYVQKEIKFALDIAEEKPEGAIFLIPARLEDCAVPERLSRWQWVDLYDENGFIQLLRSLKLRADAVGAAVEPTPYIDSDKEIESRLEQLYTEGLAAFYTEDWDRACQRFQSILSERPSHKNAAEKLAEAERQRNLSRLYEQASVAVRGEDWGSAIKTLEELTQKSAEYKDAASLLRNTRKQKQLRELYAEAGKLHAAQKWQAVVKVFEQIAAIEPNYPDPNGLLPSAQKKVAELQRLAELNHQYSQGVREMDAGNWYEARRLLEAVHKSQMGFLETEKLLKKVENEIAREEQKRKQNDQVNTLYEQAHGLLRSKKWRNALDKIGEIQKLDEHFPDTNGIAEKAQKELAREEQEAERQNKLAVLYAEAVRLLKEEKYQEALDNWREVKAVDPKYPDRQWVARTARRKLGKSVRQFPTIRSNFSIQNIGIGWFILFAALGFGLVRLVGSNLATVFRIDLPNELIRGMAGALQGLITALMLGMIEREWKWKSLPVFGVFGAVAYPAAVWAFGKTAMLLITSMVFALAPAVSVILSSVWTRRVKQWQTYMLIFIGWILAWVIGMSVSDYVNPVLHESSLRWVFRDILAGGIGLWITIELLKPGGTGRISGTDLEDERKLFYPAKLLLMASLSIAIIRVIWGLFQDWLHIWENKYPSPTQITFYIVLGGLYGFVVANALRKVVRNWKIQNTLTIIIGWALGLVGALLAGQINLDFRAVVMAMSGLSVAVAIARADQSVSPLKLTLIFLCWALTWKYGNILGGFLNANLATDYIWCYVDAVTVLFGLLGTLGIYEYSTDRLVKITFAATIGFAAGNFLGTALYILLRLGDQIGVPLALALWGFIGGAVFEVPSRNLKKILINGGFCTIGLVVGYFAALILLSRFIDLKNILWGLGLGIALSLSSRRISIITVIATLGSAAFVMTSRAVSDINTATLWGNVVRGAWIGLVLGFGYAYLTRDFKSERLQLNEK